MRFRRETIEIGNVSVHNLTDQALNVQRKKVRNNFFHLSKIIFEIYIKFACIWWYFHCSAVSCTMCVVSKVIHRRD